MLAINRCSQCGAHPIPARRSVGRSIEGAFRRGNEEEPGLGEPSDDHILRRGRAMIEDSLFFFSPQLSAPK